MILADKAILGVVSESSGRNASEPEGSLVRINSVTEVVQATWCQP